MNVFTIIRLGIDDILNVATKSYRSQYLASRL